ncbi:MAG: hypothetical protein O3A36_02745 [bacterium]|nr:hypothetical protein [bacterium]
MHKGLVGTAFLGLLLSGYLLIAYVSPEPVPCVSGGGCQAAQQSKYSSFLNVPTPAYGMIFYISLAILASLWNEDTKNKILPLLVILVSSGLAVSAFLTYIEAFVLKAWCSWCVASAVLVVVASCMTIKLVLDNKNKPYAPHI